MRTRSLSHSHPHSGAPVAALTDPDPLVRQSGARAIGRLGVHASAVLRHVADLLGHRRAEVRGAAAQARDNYEFIMNKSMNERR